MRVSNQGLNQLGPPRRMPTGDGWIRIERWRKKRYSPDPVIRAIRAAYKGGYVKKPTLPVFSWDIPAEGEKVYTEKQSNRYVWKNS